MNEVSPFILVFFVLSLLVLEILSGELPRPLVFELPYVFPNFALPAGVLAILAVIPLLGPFSRLVRTNFAACSLV